VTDRLERSLLCVASADGKLTLESRTPCGGCGAACPSRALPLRLGLQLHPGMELDLAPGDPVRLEVSRRGLTRVAALVFGLPVAVWVGVSSLLVPLVGEAPGAGFGFAAGVLCGLLAARGQHLLGLLAPRLLGENGSFQRLAGPPFNQRSWF
jgi:positive regulator of sigma E activity